MATVLAAGTAMAVDGPATPVGQTLASEPTGVQLPEASVVSVPSGMPVQASPLGLTVSGGVSLGAYEAGFLYYHLQMLTQLPDLVQLKGATGASAGSLNALLALMQACTPSVPQPHESLFWRAWIPIGVRELFPEQHHDEDVQALGLFSRRWMHQVAGMVRREWDKGFPTSCDMAWGVAVTRLYPRNVALARNRLDLPRIEEKFTLRIEGRGVGVAPRVRNFFHPLGGMEQTLLVEDAHGEVGFNEVRDATFASCSFPLAFAPMALRYCVTGRQQPTLTTRCGDQDAALGWFVDGGVLDNSPLRLLARTVAAGLAKGSDGHFHWQGRAKADEVAGPSNAYYMFVSPDAADYPSYEAVGHESSPHSAIALVKQVMASFVSTARTKELYTLLEERPDLRDRIFLPRRHLPTASGLLSAFFGFFDRDLRIYDFYLGMYDARRAFEEDVRPQLLERYGLRALGTVYPEERGMDAPELAEQWLPLLCLRGLFDNEPALVGSCADKSLRNFRILAQTSLTRLYDHCAALTNRQPLATSNDGCLAAGRGDAPPHVPGVHWPPWMVWRRAPQETQLDYLLRLLGAHGYAFTDLGLGRGQSDRALYLIRQRLAQAASSLAAKQPLSERNLLQLGAEFAIDYALWAPPRALLYATLSRSVELGANFALGSQTKRAVALRLDLPIWFDGLFSWMTSTRDSVGVGTGLGLELMYSRPRARWLQWRTGLRAGFMFSGGDSWLRAACTAERRRTLGGCSRPRLEWTLGLTALEHLRLQLAAAWYLPRDGHREIVWAVNPGIGLQF